MPGWTETICVSCSNAHGDIQDYDNFVVTQIQSPCMTTLTTAATAPTNPTFSFDDVTTIETIGGWTLFVQNSDTTNCPISSCDLKAQGCSSAYSAG